MNMSINNVVTGKQSSTRDFFRIIFRQKWVVLTVLATVMLTTFIGFDLKTPRYEAQVKMLISAEKQTATPYFKEVADDYKTALVVTQSEIVKSTPVMERVTTALNLSKRPLDYEKQFASPLKAFIVDLRVKKLEEKISKQPLK